MNSLANPTPPESAHAVKWTRWIVPAVGIALMPKCVLCVLGLLALATGIGSTAREFCGSAPATNVGTLLAWSSGIAIGSLIFAGHRIVRARALRSSILSDETSST